MRDNVTDHHHHHHQESSPDLISRSISTPIGLSGFMGLICGACGAKTVKAAVLVALPPGAVTEIGPVVAPAGTIVRIVVAVEEATVAGVPLNVIAFCPLLALKPVP